jgi:hypothetical protein
MGLARLNSLVYCLWARPGVYPRVEHPERYFTLVDSNLTYKHFTILGRLARY